MHFRSRNRTQARPSSCRGRIGVLVWALTASLSAQTVYWDTNARTAGAGATPNGTWTTVSSARNWTTSSAGTATTTAWTSGASAVFSAGTDATSAFNVTVAGTQNVAGITVQEGSPNISGGTLNFTGTAPAISVTSGTSTIGSTITGTSGLTKTGAGTLTLSGSTSNTYTGTTTVSGGTLELAKTGSATAVSNTVVIGGGTSTDTLRLGAANQAPSTASVTFNNAGGTPTLNLDGFSQTLGSISSTNPNATIQLGTPAVASTFAVGDSTSTTFAGSITGGGNAEFTKQGSGTLTLTGATSTIGTTHLNAGELSIGGAAATTLTTGSLDALAGTSLTIASGSKVISNYTTDSTFSGALAGAGEFQKSGAAKLTFNNSFSAPNLTLTLSGGTLSLLGGQYTLGTINITGNTILDFNNIAGTSLSSSNLTIDASAQVTVNNWTSTANQPTQSTVWYATNTINSVPLGGTDVIGGTPLNQIAFTNYNGMTTTWVSGNHNGWFNHEIRPTPEPATYGAILLAGCLALLAGRRMTHVAATR